MTKKLILSSIFILTLAFFTNLSFSQSMTFCESVDNSGNPTGASSVFTIPSGGGYLDVLVNLGSYTVSCTSVNYVIYLDGQYNTTISQDTQTNWQWFYKKITFYSSGTYTIACTDCNNNTLASANLTINFQ